MLMIAKCFSYCDITGHQYQYNVRKDMYCEELAPLHLMYDRGHLVAFAWFFVADIQSPVFEKIPQTMYSVSFFDFRIYLENKEPFLDFWWVIITVGHVIKPNKSWRALQLIWSLTYYI